MAMMMCPHCGEQVSDKAKKCVYCGEILIAEEKKYCVECGMELEEGITECPKCGCPVESTKIEDVNGNPQQVELTGVKITKKMKKMIGIIASILILGTIIAFVAIQHQKAEEVQVYADNLETVTRSMFNGASKAEDCGNLIKEVWYNAIYKEDDPLTDRYTKKDKKFVSDFNLALGTLFADSGFSEQIDNIENNQKRVNSLMKELKNPPEEYKDAYDALLKLYDAYISLTNCVIDPTGSLQTYSTTFNDADTNTANAYKAMKLYLED